MSQTLIVSSNDAESIFPGVEYKLRLVTAPSCPLNELTGETNQPYPEGIFKGDEYDFEKTVLDTIFIFHDLQDDHYTWIQNMQLYFRSFNSRKDHQFCAKCLGWIRGAVFHTNSCI